MAIAPKYQYEIRIYNAAGAVIATRAMRPIWSDKVTREYAKQSGEQFFRASLNGELSLLFRCRIKAMEKKRSKGQ